MEGSGTNFQWDLKILDLSLVFSDKPARYRVVNSDRTVAHNQFTSMVFQCSEQSLLYE